MRTPVRWGLVFCVVLVGTVALFRGLAWYFDPLRDAAAAERASLPAEPQPGASSTLSQASPEEIALLGSAAPENQLRGARALRARAATPDVIAAVDAALQRFPIDREVEIELVCLKSAFRDAAAVDFLIARFPKDPRELDGALRPDVACMLEGLTRRIVEYPERVSAAILPAVHSNNPATRSRALDALERLRAPGR